MSPAVTKATVALDIETVGQAWDTLDAEVRQYLLDRARTEERREEVPERLALHPATGRVVAIGFWYPDERRGRVLAEGEAQAWRELDADAQIQRGTEETILREFWRMVGEECGTVITFRGRHFDAPYLMIRSAILGVEPSRNLMPYRYSFQEHCDLSEVLSFWNTRQPDGNLEFWCRQFGIPSSKEMMKGSDVAPLYRAGRLEDIARYCLGDARATADLYLRLRPVIRLLTGNAR